MEKSTKTILIISIVTILIGGTVLGIFAGKKKRDKAKKEKEDLLKEIEAQKNLSAAEKAKLIKDLEAKKEQEVQAAITTTNTNIGNVRVGKFAYPKGSSTNIRYSAYVNNGWVNNIIRENAKGKLGVVLKVVPSTEYGDKKKWYKIQLTQPYGGYTWGYVREDVITLKNS
jgi:hypothetical protein